jgi:hypothetical protein
MTEICSILCGFRIAADHTAKPDRDRAGQDCKKRSRSAGGCYPGVGSRNH